MTKRNAPATDDLTETITVRITPTDEAQLAAVVSKHPLARRGAVAREALRRGLASLEAESKGSRRP
jgi:hypothetical protein